MSTRIKITRQSGTTNYEFETVQDTGSNSQDYVKAQKDAEDFEKWLSEMPDRIRLADERSRQGAR